MGWVLGLGLPHTCSATAEVYLVTRKLARLSRKETHPESSMSPHRCAASGSRSRTSQSASYSVAGLGLGLGLGVGVGLGLGLGLGFS